MYKILCLLVLSFFTTAVFAASNSERPLLNIGANFLLLGQSASINSPHKNGFRIQEMELQLNSAIDPYWNGVALLSVESETSAEGLVTYELAPEEIYFENSTFNSLSLKLGLQKLPFGKLNAIHSHALPFIDPTLSVSEIFGEEGLNETAATASYLMPTPWYFDLTVEAFNPVNDRAFRSSTRGDLGAIVVAKNLWDLSSESTLEWIASLGQGKNKTDQTTQIVNSAFTYKTRPLEGGRSSSFSATVEYSEARLHSGLDDSATQFDNLKPIQALSAWAQFQLAQSWFLSLRSEWAKTYRETNFAAQSELNKQTLLLAYAPTHFSAARLQFDQIHDSLQSDPEKRVGVQLNFSMGAHPAHSY